jgi:hypothetical protein
MKANKIGLLIMIACIISFKMFAQGILPGDPDTSVPLDGGLSIAIIAGVSYGAKRLMKKKKENTEATTANKKK